jgi:hypothetical protein
MLPLSLAALVRLYNLPVWLSHLPRSVTLNNSYTLIELAEIGLDCLSVAYLAQIVGDIGQTDLTRLGTTKRKNSLLASGIVYVAGSLLAVYALCRTRSSMPLLHLDLGPLLLLACGKEPLGSSRLVAKILLGAIHNGCRTVDVGQLFTSQALQSKVFDHLSF